MKDSLQKLVLIAMILSLMGNGVAGAQSDTDASVSGGNISIGRCIKKGGLDFKLFWDAIIYNDDLKEGMLEPWYDVLYRNQCHANDVIGLIKQQDKVRKAIRSAFLTCKTEKLPTLKKGFHKLTAEIYYVRHIVDGGIVVSLPFDLLTHRFFTDAAVKDRGILYSEMYEKYAKEGFLSQSDFDALFLLLETKYGPGKTDEPFDEEEMKEFRWYSYIVCEKGSWKAVGEKWDEFKEFFSEDFGGLKEAGEGISDAASRVGAEFTEPGKKFKIMDVINGDMSLGAYAASFVTANLNNQAPAEGFADIMKQYEKNTPFGGGGSGDGGGGGGGAASTSDILGSLAYSTQLFNIETTQIKMAANFAVLYGNVSDETSEAFLNTLDGRQTNSDKEDGLIEIIHYTYPEINKIIDGAKKMIDRQCP